MSKRQFISCSSVAAIICLSSASSALAQTPAQHYPSKTIRFVVPYTPGSGVDTVARLLTQRLGERWRVRALVDNRPGAGSTLGTDIVAKSPPDGYTLLMTGGAMTTNASMYTQLPYDPVADFQPLSLVITTPQMLVANLSLPVKGLKELAVLAKARPGEITYGSGGYGATQHLTMELLSLTLGIKLNHVPYKGAAPAMSDAVAGQISLAISTPGSSATYVRAGRLKALAVTSLKRNAAFPDVPTVSEQGWKDFESLAWFGIFGPRGVGESIVGRLSAEIGAIVKLADTQDKVAKLGYDPVGSSAQEFDAFYRMEIARWAKVIREAKLEKLAK